MLYKKPFQFYEDLEYLTSKFEREFEFQKLGPKYMKFEREFEFQKLGPHYMKYEREFDRVSRNLRFSFLEMVCPYIRSRFTVFFHNNDAILTESYTVN